MNAKAGKKCPDCGVVVTDVKHCGSPSCPWGMCTKCARVFDPVSGRSMRRKSFPTTPGLE